MCFIPHCPAIRISVCSPLMSTIDRKRATSFRRKIRRFYKRHGRVLPFRQTTDPYCITVSEIMLQQTQVDRVVPKYEAWVVKWPDWQSLAGATKQELLAMWSGLGYNRRALYLGQIAQTVVEEYSGRLPDDPAELIRLPGIGRYTSRAILIFAYNRPLVTADTNIRRVILHELDLPPSTSASEIEDIAEQLLPRRDSRNWHYALMDYSSLALPKRLVAIPPTTKQSRFQGSIRQIRGEIIRHLTVRKSVRVNTIAESMERTKEDVQKAAENLAREGLVEVRGSTIRLVE